MVQAHEDEEVIIEAPGDDEAAGGSVSEPGPRTWSSLVKSGAGAAQAGASKQAPAACPKEGTPVFQGDRGACHQKPSGSGYASLRQRASSSQGRSPGQRQSERYSKDTEEANTRPGSEMTVKNG